MRLVFLLVAALLALALGEEHPADTTGGALLLNGTFLDSQIPFDQVNFKPMTKWEGGLEKGVAYRIFQAMPGIVSWGLHCFFSCVAVVKDFP